jgi:hypothetical protein
MRFDATRRTSASILRFASNAIEYASRNLSRDLGFGHFRFAYARNA